MTDILDPETQADLFEFLDELPASERDAFAIETYLMVSTSDAKTLAKEYAQARAKETPVNPA